MYWELSAFVQMNLEYLTIDTQVCLSLGGLVACYIVGLFYSWKHGTNTQY